MTKLNRSGALLLALVLFLSLLLPYAGALSEPEDDVVTTQTIDGVTYELHADYAVLINGKQAKGDLVLPAEVDGRPLERIEIWAFQSNTALTSVVIPDTVTQIGGSAFEQCESLESISFGDGIEILPNGVCDYCFSLHTVRLPAALKEIGDDAFSFCFALEELTLPASLRRIGRSAFSSTRIRQLLFPAGLEEIGSSAFYDTPLGMVYLSPSFRYDALTSMGSTTESVRALGAYIYHVYHHGTAAETYVNKLKAQDGDANVYSYALPDTGQLYMTASGVYQLEKGEMTLLLYPAMLSTAPFLVDSYVNGVPVTSVGPNAFRESHNHGGDRIIILPPTVTTISEYAFSDIKNGLVVHIPSSVTSIHETAFDGLEYIVIYGVPGSEAERFAKRHGIRFETDVSGVLPFTDVKPAAWYYGSVVYAYYNGLMNGVSRTRFAPGQSMSRAMLVQVLYNLSGGPAECAGFEDVAEGSWYYDAVNWAASAGIVNGKSPTEFAPEDPVTREQTVAILQRYAAQFGPVEGTEDVLSGFADADRVSDYAKPAMAWAVESGLIAGTSPTTLSPTAGATRAQMATILMRFLNQLDPQPDRSADFPERNMNAVALSE